MTLELGRTPTQSEVFARTHTRKEDWSWVDKRSEDVNDVFIAELKRLQEERQAIIDAGDPEDDDTASGPPDLREQVTLLNREISQQAEAHAQSLAALRRRFGPWSPPCRRSHMRTRSPPSLPPHSAPLSYFFFFCSEEIPLITSLVFAIAFLLTR
ncbi:hypothetical protein PIB30_037110 [Stylosanthes scabra]|uniref:Uncharacterized protein n=1 Tax=Stylosanthes scabra TaxID=79078 RepID=A0ABU6YE00_9FABA|nr:hypothetical protein [Stylosanthes scabra]